MGPRGPALSLLMRLLVLASVDLFMTVLWSAWGVWDAVVLAVDLSRRSSRFMTVLLEEPLERLETVLGDMIRDGFCVLDQ